MFLLGVGSLQQASGASLFQANDIIRYDALVQVVSYRTKRLCPTKRGTVLQQGKYLFKAAFSNDERYMMHPALQ